MKKRSKQLFALLLSAGMLVTQFPSQMNVVYADNTAVESSDSTDESADITDDTVIATNDYDWYYNNHGDADVSHCTLIDGYNDIFYLVAKSLGISSQDNIKLTYGQVKDITDFEIPYEENDGYSSVNVSGMENILPNIQKLTSNRMIYGYTSAKLKELNVNIPQYSYESFYLTDCFDVSQLESFSYVGYNLYLDTELCGTLKKLAVTGDLSMSYNDGSYADMANLEELHLNSLLVDDYTTSKSNLQQNDIDSLSKLEKLQTIDFSGTDSVSGLDLSALAGMKSLKSLNVSNCNLQNDSFDFSGFTVLDTLNVANNSNLIKALAIKKVPEKFASDEEWVHSNFSAENEVVTTGSKKSEYYVPDENLYAIIKNKADTNSDGILTVAEAWAVTYVNFDWYNEANDLSKVTDFTGLGDVLKNVSSLYLPSNIDKQAMPSLIAELSKMQNLTDFTCYTSFNQEQFDALCDNLSKVSSVRINGDEELDLTNISKLTELTSLYIGSSNVKNASSLNSLMKLSSLEMNMSGIEYSEVKDILNRVSSLTINQLATVSILSNIGQLTQLSSLNINTSYYEMKDVIDGKMSLDLSKLSNLSYLNYNGYNYIESITLPENADELHDVYVYVYNSYNENFERCELNNLDKCKKLHYLHLDGVALSDLDDLAGCSELYSIWLDNTGINSLDGIKNLKDLNSLSLYNEPELKSVDLSENDRLYDLTISSCQQLSEVTGFDKLPNLEYLTICDNSNLSKIECDMSGLSELKELTITGNRSLKAIPESISKLKGIKVLHLQNNALESLPDLSALCTKEGLLDTDYSPRYYYIGNDEDKKPVNKLRLYGNGLTRADIEAAKLSSDYMDDANWLIWSTTSQGKQNGYIYSELTESYILYALERGGYDSMIMDNTTFTFKGDMTMSAEALKYIQDCDKYSNISLNLISEDGNVVAHYDLKDFVTNNWDKKSSFTFEAPRICNVDDYASYFSKKPLMAYSFDYDDGVTTGGNVGLYYSQDETSSYNIYLLDKKTKEKYSNSYAYYWGIDSKYDYIITDSDTRYYNNVQGVSSENQIVPLSDCGILVGDFVETDNSYEFVISDEFKNAIKNAADGATIKGYIKTSGFSFDTDLLEMLRNKNITLDIIYGYDVNDSQFAVNSENTVTYSSDESIDSYSWFSASTPWLYEMWDSEVYAPYKLFNGIVASPFTAVGYNSTKKMYYGNQYKNGDELYVYYIDNANRKIDLVASSKVAWGYVTFENLKQYNYYITDSKLAKTTWTVDDEYHEIATPDEPEVKPDEPEVKPSEPEVKPSEPEVKPSEPEVKPSEPEVKPSEPEVKPSEPEVKPSEPEVKPSEPEVKPSEPEVKPSEPEVKPSEPEIKPDDKVDEKVPENITLPQIKADKITSDSGVKSAPSKITSVEKKADAISVLENKMTTTSLPRVEVITKNSAPEMNAGVFESAKKNNKDITFGVADENDNLLYSWTFQYDNLDTSKMNGKAMDLSISFASEKKKEIEELTGQTNGVYISIAGYHGELPGPATVKTYVGDQYKNGDTVYLYYYNEETKKVELIGGKGLVVNGGYVEYTLTHCSTYFITTNTPDSYGIDTSDNNPDTPDNPGTPDTPSNPEQLSKPVNPKPQNNPAPEAKKQQVVAKPASQTKSSIKNKNSANTGDDNLIVIPTVIGLIGIGLIAACIFRRKKQA